MAGVEPVMVFSGHENVLKTSKHAEVVHSHEDAMQQGKRLLECMRSTTDATCRQKLRHEALACFQRGLQVTPAVERNCIAALRRVGVMVVVAPYEAEAQLASLCRSGICQAVLTEDPSLILYGVISEKPFPILYRFDSTGMVLVVNLSEFASSLTKRAAVSSNPLNKKKKNSPSHLGSGPPPKHNSSSSSSDQLLTFLCQLLNTTHGRRLFIHMCLLLGNDYIEPICEGITLPMAQKLIMKFADTHPDGRLSAMKKYVDSGEGMTFITGRSPASPVAPSLSLSAPRSPTSNTSSYLDRLFRIEIMLYYHPIFDPKLKNIRNYSTPNYAPSNAASVSDSDSPYPAVSFMDVFRLGHSAHVLHGVAADKSSVVTIETLCEGSYGMCDYQLIEPSLPWENQRIALLSRQKVSLQPRFGQGGVWHNRAMLVRSLAAYIPASGVSALPPSSSSSSSCKQQETHPTTARSTTSGSSGCSGKQALPLPAPLSPPPVRSLLAPSRGPILPPPSSSIFKQESERFHREYCRLVAAHQAAALRSKRAAAAVAAAASSSAPPAASSAVVDSAYKSPPTRKLNRANKNNIVSATKDLLHHAKRGEVLAQIETKELTAALANRGTASNIAGQEENVLLNVTSSGTRASVAAKTAPCLAGGVESVTPRPADPVRTPPAPSSSAAGSMPLSPDRMRLATPVSTVHTPVIHRKQRQCRGESAATSSSQGGGGGASPEMSFGKRKQRGVSTCESGSVSDMSNGKDSSSKKKRLVVTSITSYFKASPSVTS
jgi:hypothetical protein